MLGRRRLTSPDEAAVMPHVLAAALADGGREVSLGSVRNTLGVIAGRGDVVRLERGLDGPDPG